MAVFEDFESKSDIFELMEKFEKSSLTEIEIESGADFRIKMQKNINRADPGPAVYVPEAKSAAEVVIKAPDESGAKTIKSPLVGTFYSSPSPDSGPYVKVGDSVTKGMAVCIIEAMKTMNEIESDTDGEIAEILAENGGPVEYGQILFRLK